jgi:signal transduction histidine kinase
MVGSYQHRVLPSRLSPQCPASRPVTAAAVSAPRRSRPPARGRTPRLWSPSTGALFGPRTPRHLLQRPAKANSGRSSLSANQVGVLRGFVSAYSQNDVAGTRQRFLAESQPRQCGLETLRMLVTGWPPNCSGPGMPQRAMTSSRSPSALFRILLPDGTIKHIKSTAHPKFSASGELVEVVSTIIDVTERKRAREEHQRLRQLESDLAHMNRLSMMGELAASLAHEITQPIATARNNARAALNFLEKQPSDLGEVREALSCVVGDADRAGVIIDRMRDHIRKAPPRKHRFDLNEAINEVIVLARSAIAENGVSVQTRLTEGLVPVEGDRVQLQQVLLNLVLNAAEAMSAVDEGARALWISTEQSRTEVLATVRDSGPGIDPERIERVFDAFYTTKADGVGMGLSICRSIIDAHGGRLWADANEPRGAAFQFTLPGSKRSS